LPVVGTAADHDISSLPSPPSTMPVEAEGGNRGRADPEGDDLGLAADQQW
jgi:hypothetical protein